MDAATVGKLKQKIQDQFPFVVPRTEMTFEVAEDRAIVTRKDDGFKATTLDGLDVVLVTINAITNSRLAPYLGWPRFRDRAEQVWRDVKDIVGYRKVARVGVRYINRLDIPGTEFELGQFLRVGFSLPDSIGLKSDQYRVVVVLPLADNEFAHIQSGTVDPALAAHGSILLDVDIFKQGDVPQKDDELWALIDRFRDLKNRVFEECLTDKARELFDRPLEQ